MRTTAIVAAAATLLSTIAVAVSTPVGAAPLGDDQVVAFEVRGVGNGHGRGMSQWGAFGRAIAGQSWQEIVDTYYRDTESATRVEPNLRVRLTGWDGDGSVGVISAVSKARWAAVGENDTTDYSSLYAGETAPNTFTVWGSTEGRACEPEAALVVPPADLTRDMEISDDVRDLQRLLNHFDFDAGPVDGDFGQMTEAAVVRFQQAEGLAPDGEWQAEEVAAAQERLDAEPDLGWEELAVDVAGPITFSTTVNEAIASAGSVLGVCKTSGSVRHYRGSIEFHHTGVGNRVVNVLDVEQYLRGVLPKEVSASWGDAADGDGMNALQAQAVAARSYGMAQNRYAYASTCDTSSCQVYGGAGTRSSPGTANSLRLEQPNTDEAIVDTAGTVREWPNGDIVSTEFSASNGPTTAGGAFPPVVDPFDDQPGNPNHRWTRIIDADEIIARYGLDDANDVITAPDSDSPYDGIWANEVRLGGNRTVSAWDFRNAFNLPAPGFELVPITRGLTDAASFAFIGDSVGRGVAVGASSPFQVLTEGVFSPARFDAVVNRRTVGGSVSDGVDAAGLVPVGTDLVVVELGYNDDPAAMASRIDAVMQELRDRDVELVLWVNLSERRSTPYEVTNAALVAATDRWSELVVRDWNQASSSKRADRWFDDGVHLTTTGNAEFARWLRDEVVGIVADGYAPPRTVVPGQPLRIPVLGVGGVPSADSGEGVVGVALNVTSVFPVGPGFLRVWPCGSVEPGTSSVNWVASGSVEPNAVVVPVDASGEVCVSSLVETDVIVDVTGWFESGLRGAVGRLVDTRESGVRVESGDVLRVPVLDGFGVPAADSGEGVVGVALNVTSVFPVGPGFLRVWPCGSVEPGTSSVNWVASGSVEPNAVVVPVDASGEVCVSSLVETDVIVDVTGWFESGLRGAVGRLVDTRESGVRVESGDVLRVPVLDGFGVPAADSGEGVVGVALNVTSVFPVGPGFLRVWPCGSVEPGTSSVNWVASGSVEPNAVVVPVDASGEVCVSSLVETDVIVDVTGWFDSGLQPLAGERIVDTRFGIGPTPPR